MNERPAQEASVHVRHGDEYRTPASLATTHLPQTTSAVGVNRDGRVPPVKERIIMRKHSIVGISLLCAVLGGFALPVSARSKAPRSTVDNIRHELLQLPYYGVFDFMSFKYDKGTVDLMGYAYRPTLRSDAERAVKRVAGVDVVNDLIEELPVSINDDNLRWQTYYAIYRDPFLSRYAPGGGLLWGHRHPFRGGASFALGPSRFPGTEPAGDYPIHIIVKQGRITLLGVVDSESDKTVAGMRARGVSGSFGVDNELVVDHPAPSESAR
jgi:hyperosmotically inducible protein